jgi:putative polyhydroxyalkanoate system protein
MPRIKIEHPHSMDLQVVREKMEKSLNSLAAKHDITVTWKDDKHVDLKRSGLKGTAEIREKSVCVDLDLSFVLSPLKGKIEQRLREKLTQELS